MVASMWHEKTNLQYGVKLSIPTTAEFLIGPHKLKIQEISIKFWWVFFLCFGVGVGHGSGVHFFPSFLVVSVGYKGKFLTTKVFSGSQNSQYPPAIEFMGVIGARIASSKGFLVARIPNTPPAIELRV